MRLNALNGHLGRCLPVLNYKVEIGFEKLTSLGSFFTLDDATKGVLNNATYTLGGGGFFYDVTSYIKEFSVSRGKSRELDRYTAGGASVVFDNTQRVFDPTYTASPFYGEIVPRRKLRISVEGLYVFVGVIDDWNLAYSPGGRSEAEANAVDAFSVLSNLILSTDSYSAELSSTRIQNILDDPQVSWPTEDRAISIGDSILAAETIAENTNALTYLQSIETSEPGQLFIGRDGSLNFYARNEETALTSVVFADDGSGIEYTNLEVTYGSELLYNEVTANSPLLSLSATASDADSQSSYGLSSLNVDTLLNSASELSNYATYLVGQYADPEYRFEALEVNLLTQSDTVRDTLLGLELGQVVEVIFTPNGLPPAIQKYARIVGVQHSVGVSTYKIVLKFATVESLAFTLDSPALGRLDVNKLAW